MRSLCSLALGAFIAGCQAVPSGDRTDPTPGGQIAFNEQGGLWLMQSDGSARRLLMSSAAAEVVEPAFSPDGRRIAFSTGVHLEGPNAPPYKVVVMNLDGSAATAISPPGGGRMPAWSPDGSRIAFSSKGRLMTARPDGSDLKDLLILGDCPVWSPDSRQIAFCGAGLGGENTAAVFITNADGSGIRKLTADAANVFPGAWSPDGRELAYTSGTQVEGDVFVTRTDGSSTRRLVHAPGTHAALLWLSDDRIVYSDSREDQPKTAWRVIHANGSGDRALSLRLFDPIAWLPDEAERSKLRAVAARIVPRPTATAAGSEVRQLIDVGGHRLFLDCSGRGPTVVLDAGLGVDSRTWLGVQNALASQSRVCRYDRAGLGLSDPGPSPRGSGVLVNELHTLLQAAGVQPPYVLVGASFGGLNVQLFERTFPDEVSGLVLVDSLHPMLDSAIEALLNRDQILERRRQLEMNGEGLSFEDILRSESLVEAHFGKLDKPVVVLRHGLPFEASAGFPSANVEALWLRLQEDLAARSSRGGLVVATRSHHRISETEPGLVADAVRRILSLK